jgi:hypothetical protein
MARHYGKLPQSWQGKTNHFYWPQSWGALATLASAQLLDEEARYAKISASANPSAPPLLWAKPFVASLYTYGSPEIGDAKFQSIANGMFFKARPIRVASGDGSEVMQAPPVYSARFINFVDIVPQIPGTNKFRHVWNALQIDAAGKINFLGGSQGESSAGVQIDNPLFSSGADRREKIIAGLSYHASMKYMTKILQTDPNNTFVPQWIPIMMGTN